jgi:hypothetical protein
MESSGKPFDLKLPPFRPRIGLVPPTVLPALRDVIKFQDSQTPSVLLAVDAIARSPAVEKSPVSSGTQGIAMEDTSSLKWLLPAGVGSNKKRTPLSNSRPLGALFVPYDVSSRHPSNGKKRPRASGDEEYVPDSEVRAWKRPCQGHPTVVDDVDWSLDENKDIKPPFSYVQMAKTAILNSREAVLALDGILAFITANYAYYRLLHDKKALKKSIYNCLRSCKSFEKVGKSTVTNAQRWQVKAGSRVENMPVWKPTLGVPFQAKFARPYTWSNPPP